MAGTRAPARSSEPPTHGLINRGLDRQTGVASAAVTVHTSWFSPGIFAPLAPKPWG